MPKKRASPVFNPNNCEIDLEAAKVVIIPKIRKLFQCENGYLIESLTISPIFIYETPPNNLALIYS
ncbi:hypothetical protein A994_12161 [Methanobacterium formicicum DSM 3637]|uniref:Uncharacterized protein n=1 Tax=Methanobacterium formicicum (strain DSM 3637 / PP1) TaxID=1204725 RepID=K2R8Y7_METFP|nr:hypothetical protein A994_12161 [Methanobacterium formicicum DSM 3637]